MPVCSGTTLTSRSTRSRSRKATRVAACAHTTRSTVRVSCSFTPLHPGRLSVPANPARSAKPYPHRGPALPLPYPPLLYPRLLLPPPPPPLSHHLRVYCMRALRAGPLLIYIYECCAAQVVPRAPTTTSSGRSSARRGAHRTPSSQPTVRRLISFFRGGGSCASIST